MRVSGGPPGAPDFGGPIPLPHDDAGVAMNDGGPVSTAAEPASVTGAGEDLGDGRAIVRARRRLPYWPAVGVAALGLVITGVLVWLSASTYTNNENRLLTLRVRDAGALIAEALPGVQTPLASSAALADATGGDVQRFRSFIAPSVGTGRQYVSVSLWRLGASGTSLLSVVGTTPVLAQTPARAVSFFTRAASNAQLSVIGLLQGPQPRLGYAFTSPGLTGHFVAYAESALPASRHSKLQSTSSFTDLHYALYLGRTQNSADLLVSDLKTLPIGGHRASTTIPFGDNAFTFVVAAKHPLEGTFAQRLALADRDRRGHPQSRRGLSDAQAARPAQQAEQLARSLERIAEENRRLYSEQRTIAQTLQHALLPEGLPEIHGVESGARYEAGVEGRRRRRGLVRPDRDSTTAGSCSSSAMSRDGDCARRQRWPRFVSRSTPTPPRTIRRR